jgi:electron transport complex protein RnfD
MTVETGQTEFPERQLAISAAPHRRHWLSVKRMMYLTLLALLLPTAAAIYFFGYHALSVIAVSVATAVATEYLVKKLRGRPFVMDGNAVVIGLLLALVLPPTIPPWMVAVGAVISVAIVKEAFGGLGHYIFNPALGGMAFVFACFPTEMTTWVEPTGFSSKVTVAAAPLSDAFAQNTSKLAMLLGNTSGALGETSALLIVIAGSLLIALRIIDWRIPATYIGTVFIF